MNELHKKELTINDVLIVFRRRYKLWATVTVAIFLLVCFYCAIATRRYEAAGTIQVQKDSSDMMGLENMLSGAADGASDAVSSSINISTQAQILQSETLALRAIEELNLEGTYDFQSHWRPWSWLFAIFSPKGLAESASLTLENAPGRRRRAVKTFEKNLKVKPVSGTRLVEISYTNPDPVLASSVVNKLMQALVDFNFQTRFSATNQASGWLRGQIGDLRKDSEDLQRQMSELQSQSGVYALGNIDSTGKEIAYSGVLDQLQQKTQALNQAEQNRILRGAILRAAQNGDAEMLSGLAGNSIVGPGAANNSLQLLQSLRQQESAQKAALAEAEAKYGASYPKIAEMHASLHGVQNSIQQEVERIKGRARSDYAIAQQSESASKADYEKAKQEADKLNDKAIEFAIVRQEAESSRKLYEELLAKLKEAGVLEGLKSSNITIVDPGRIPDRPAKPKVFLLLAGGLSLGMFVGMLISLIVDAMDNKLHSVYDVEEILGQDVLGVVPQIESIQPLKYGSSQLHLMTFFEPKSTFSEAIRAIRTSILLTRAGSRAHVILVTSSLPGEGKSVLSTNLSVAMAQTGKKVLLVDSDLRKGSIRKRLLLEKNSGFAELLAGVQENPSFLQLDALPMLSILQAGNVPPNPSELLGSPELGKWIDRWRQEFDYIVFDTAPILPVTDAMILHPLVDVTLLVTRSGVTERPQLRRSSQILQQEKSCYVGVVLNALRAQDESYYGYYGYRKYAYEYGEDDAQD